MQSRVASLTLQKAVALSEFRSTLQPPRLTSSRGADRDDANKTAIAQRLSDMINVSRQISAVRDRQRKKALLWPDLAERSATTIDEQDPEVAKKASLSPLRARNYPEQADHL